MSRFAISQLLIGVSLAAILVVVYQSRRSEDRHEMIESLSFSQDNSQVLAVQLSRSEAKPLFSNDKQVIKIARTVSMLDAETGKPKEILDHATREGDLGVSMRSWGRRRTSAVCNPSNDNIAIADLGGGSVSCIPGNGPIIKLEFTRPANTIAVSKSGRLVAASGLGQISVFETATKVVRRQIEMQDHPEINAPLVTFTNDEAFVLQLTATEVLIHDFVGWSQQSKVIQGDGVIFQSLAVAPDDSLIVCSNRWVKRFNTEGEVIAELLGAAAWDCVVNPAGNQVALLSEETIHLVDLATNEQTGSLPYLGATAVAFSGDGQSLAIGDSEGRVSVIDAVTLDSRWQARAPAVFPKSKKTAAGLFVLALMIQSWLFGNRRRLHALPSRAFTAITTRSYPSTAKGIDELAPA